MVGPFGLRQIDVPSIGTGARAAGRRCGQRQERERDSTEEGRTRRSGVGREGSTASNSMLAELGFKGFIGRREADQQVGNPVGVGLHVEFLLANLTGAFSELERQRSIIAQALQSIP